MVRSRLSFLSPHSCRSGSTLSRRSLPHARYRGDLFQPRHDLYFIDIVERDQLHAPRRFAHGDGRHWRHGVERDAIDEHSLGVAGERAARDAPAIADAVVRPAPFHAALQAGKPDFRQMVDALGYATLRLLQAGDVREDFLIANRS